ncbi:hypothetical protein IKF32_00175 [Candidatus Saccharibacteria bacterium]|nr:hypothetical protein [Candidatus Saccharibacteria bacterium]
MFKKLKILAVVALVGELLFGGLNVLALNDYKPRSMMTISPPREKMILMPGETYSGSVDVANSATATKDLKYSVRVGSFSLKEDENGEADYNYSDVDTITSYNQIMNWIEIEKESGVVAPNTVDTVPYTIKVPEDAPAGGQYASIIIRNENGEDEENQDGVMIQSVVEFAVTLIADVAGETRDDGKVLDNNIPSFLLNSPLVASSTVRNDGNVHTDASYVLQVWPLFSDEEICTNEEEPTTSLIMPETERYHAEECNLPSLGIFRAKQTVKIFNDTSIVERTIIVCPIWLLFIILFVIIALIIWVFLKVKNKGKRKGRMDEE